MNLENMIRKYVKAQAAPQAVPNQPAPNQPAPNQPNSQQNEEGTGFVIDDNEKDSAQSAKKQEYSRKIASSQQMFAEQVQLIESVNEAYNSYSTTLNSAKEQLFDIDLSSAPDTACGISRSIKLDAGLITMEEFSKIYEMWKNSIIQARNEAAKLGNLYTGLVELIKESQKVIKEDLDIILSQSPQNTANGQNAQKSSDIEKLATQKYNAEIAKINSNLFNYEIQNRSYEMFYGIYPVKLEFIQHMNALCTVENHYIQARDTLKYGGLDLVKKLEEGFNQAASIVESIADLIIRYNPTVFGEQQSLLYKNVAETLRIRAERFIIEYNSARK